MKSTLNFLLRFLAGAVVGAAVAIVGMGEFLELLEVLDVGPSRLLAYLLGLPVVLFLVLLVHELGHLTGGRLAGFRAYLLAVGPLAARRTDAGWRLGLSRNPAAWAGLAASAPQKTRGLRRRMGLYFAAGPATSVLAGAGAFGLALLLGALLGVREVGASGPLAVSLLWLGTFGVLSVGLGFLTLIPGRTEGLYTDGGRLLRLARAGPEMEGEFALMAVSGLDLGGKRPREWPDDLMELSLTADPDDFVGIHARLAAHLKALDEGEHARAAGLLEEALEGRRLLGPRSGADLLLHAAWFYAVHTGRAERARELLDAAGEPVMVGQHLRAMAEGAVLIAEGDREAGVRALNEALLRLRVGMARGRARAEEEWIRELRDRARAAPTGPASSPGTP